MSAFKPARLSTAAVILFAAILGLALAVPSFSHPQTVSAQTCGAGTYNNGTQCVAYGGNNSNCTYFAYTCTGATCTNGSFVNCYNGTNCGFGSIYSAGCANCGFGSIYAAGCANCGLGSIYAAGCSNCGFVGAVGCTQGNCPVGTVWNGASCVSNAGNCPAGTTWNGSSCVASAANCPAGTTWNGSSCVASAANCPAGTTWNGSSCVAGSTTTANNTCATISLQSGQSCSNGVVTCTATGQTVAAGSSCTGAATTTTGQCTQYSPTTGQCVANAAATTAAATPTTASGTCDALYTRTESACTACPNGGSASTLAACPASTQLITCAGSSATATSQSQCPQVCPNGQILPPSASCSALAAISSTASTTGAQASYQAGWNLVSAPGGQSIAGASAPLYTWQTGDTSYETNETGSVRAGYGYWGYFASAATDTVPATTGGSVQVPLPAGTPVMIGNPGSTIATVSGADSVMVYNAVTGQYASTTTLTPGQGAWAISYAGGTATITNPSS